MIWGILVLIVASLVGSGVVVRHRRLMTYVSLAGVLFEGQWLTLTLFRRTLLEGYRTDVVYVAGAIILLGVWAFFWKRWLTPYGHGAGSGVRDLWVVSVTALVLGAAVLVTSENGLMKSEWVTHGFYNGDTATFMTLVQRSMIENGLVQQNPFSGNGELEYPTLLHGGIADFFGELGVGMDWFHFLPTMTYVQIVITVPLFFLLWDTAMHEPSNKHERWFGVPRRGIVYAIQAGIVVYVLSLGWDNYIYPQSHFFLTGLFLAIVSLLAQGSTLRGVQQWLPVGAGLAGAVVLVFSNAVTGTAACAVAVALCGLRMFDKKRFPQERMWFGILGVLLVGIFFIAMPGNGSFGMPNFSYTGAIDMVRLSLPVVLLGAGVYMALLSHVALSSFAGILIALSFISFFFSTRDIVVANASRFMYHALLAGSPLLLMPIVRLYYVAKRELLHTSYSIPQRVTAWVVSVAVILLFLFPGLSSVASAHDNLMQKDRHVVDTAMRQAVWYVRDHVPYDSVIVANPHEPFAVPIFTGRALLRTDYWLSQRDEVLDLVLGAFSGDRDAQKEVVSRGDYLLLTQEERTAWGAIVDELPVVFTVNAVTVFQISGMK